MDPLQGVDSPVIQNTFTEMSGAFVTRYLDFLEMLRRQIDVAVRKGANNATVRQDANSAMRSIAREFLAAEAETLDAETERVAQKAAVQVGYDIQVSSSLDEAIDEFISSAVQYTLQIISAQIERDITAASQTILSSGLQVEMFVRQNGMSQSAAVFASFSIENTNQIFRFADRAGRKFKSSKHMRDIYRHHLLTIYNEVYLSIASTFGVDKLYLSHPDQSYTNNGKSISINNDESDFLYYEVRDEIFHPSSNSILTARIE